MGKILRNFLVGLVAALGLVVLAFSSQTTTQAATNYTTDDLLTGMSIQQKNYGTASDINLTLNWDATGKDLQGGDTWTIDLPNTVKVTDPGNTFEVKDKDGTVLGNATLNADNTITVVFTDKIEEKPDFSGSLSIPSGVGVGKGASIGNNDVVIGNQSDNMTVVTSDADFSKKGTIGTDANGNPVVTWTILVNRNSQNYPNLKVSDCIKDDSGLTYVQGSVDVYEAHWTDNEGYYKKTGPIDSSSYNLDESSNGFTITNLPKDDQFYAITLQTTINDPENMAGVKFRNHADFEWADGSGTSGGKNVGSADGSVTSNTNSGDGNGNEVLGSATLTKKSSDGNETLIPGATYDLYKYGSDVPIKTDLTTDENGQINVKDLAYGDYYFKEVSAPSDYVVNGNEIPFTINKNQQNVSVEAKDEKASSQEGSIVIMKLDEETGYRLSGAEFTLTDEHGNVYGPTATVSNGIVHFYDLPYGTYTIKETQAPDGYLVSDKEHTVVINEQNPTPAMIDFEDIKEYVFDDTYFVRLQKFDRDDMTTGVPGAEYTLYNANDDTPIETQVTDETGMLMVDGLKPGDYYFLETKAPDGYDLNPDRIHFTIVSGEQTVKPNVTSDPRTEGNGGNGGTDPDIDDKDDEDEDGNGGNTTDPDVDGNGNENNGGNENGNNGGGIVVDPENPGSNNNGNNNNGGVITNPGNNSNSNNNSNGTLPQTGAKSGIAVSLLGFVVLLGTVYFKRRHA